MYVTRIATATVRRTKKKKKMFRKIKITVRRYFGLTAPKNVLLLLLLDKNHSSVMTKKKKNRKKQTKKLRKLNNDF